MDNWPEPGNLGVQAPVGDEPKVLATFYAVRNHEGKYYRTYDKNRSSGWKDNLEDAKLWTRIGPARAKITALSHGRGPVPELVEFVVREVNVVDQTARVAAAKAKREREEAERKAAEKKWRLQEAERELAEAQRRVEKLRRT